MPKPHWHHTTTSHTSGIPLQYHAQATLTSHYHQPYLWHPTAVSRPSHTNITLPLAIMLDPHCSIMPKPQWHHTTTSHITGSPLQYHAQVTLSPAISLAPYCSIMPKPHWYHTTTSHTAGSPLQHHAQDTLTSHYHQPYCWHPTAVSRPSHTDITLPPALSLASRCSIMPKPHWHHTTTSHIAGSSLQYHAQATLTSHYHQPYLWHPTAVSCPSHNDIILPPAISLAPTAVSCPSHTDIILPPAISLAPHCSITPKPQWHHPTTSHVAGSQLQYHAQATLTSYYHQPYRRCPTAVSCPSHTDIMLPPAISLAPHCSITQKPHWPHTTTSHNAGSPLQYHAQTTLTDITLPPAILLAPHCSFMPKPHWHHTTSSHIAGSPLQYHAQASLTSYYHQPYRWLPTAVSRPNHNDITLPPAISLAPHCSIMPKPHRHHTTTSHIAGSPLQYHAQTTMTSHYHQPYRWLPTAVSRPNHNDITLPPAISLAPHCSIMPKPHRHHTTTSHIAGSPLQFHVQATLTSCYHQPYRWLPTAVSCPSLTDIILPPAISLAPHCSITPMPHWHHTTTSHIAGSPLQYHAHASLTSHYHQPYRWLPTAVSRPSHTDIILPPAISLAPHCSITPMPHWHHTTTNHITCIRSLVWQVLALPPNAEYKDKERLVWISEVLRYDLSRSIQNLPIQKRLFYQQDQSDES